MRRRESALNLDRHRPYGDHVIKSKPFVPGYFVIGEVLIFCLKIHTGER